MTPPAPPRPQDVRGAGGIEPGAAGYSAAPADAPRAPEGRGTLVRLVIVGTALLFVVMVGALYYRWVTTVVPASIISVFGNEHLDGAVVTIAPAPGQPPREPLTAVLDKRHQYAANFYLEPGVYAASVKLEDGRTILPDRDFTLGPRRIAHWDLHAWGMPPEPPNPNVVRPRRTAH